MRDYLDRGRSKRTGHCSRRTAASSYCRTPGATVACGMGLGVWVLPMVWRPVCLGARTLGQSAAAGGCVDSRPLGCSPRGLYLHRRILALDGVALVCFERCSEVQRSAAGPGFPTARCCPRGRMRLSVKKAAYVQRNYNRNSNPAPFSTSVERRPERTAALKVAKSRSAWSA
jgi:hypothetical protein